MYGAQVHSPFKDLCVCVCKTLPHGPSSLEACAALHPQMDVFRYKPRGRNGSHFCQTHVVS